MAPLTSKKSEDKLTMFKVLAKKLDDISVPFAWMWKIVALVFAGGVAWATLYNNVSGLKKNNTDLESRQQSQAIQIYAMHDDVTALKNQMELLQYKLDRFLNSHNRIGPTAPVSTSQPAEQPVIYQTYEVQDGESLWDVAKKLNVSTDDLIRNNPDLLQPGAKFGRGVILRYTKPA